MAGKSVNPDLTEQIDAESEATSLQRGSGMTA